MVTQGNHIICKYFNKLIIEKSVVKFGPGAFKQPYHYLTFTETKANISDYKSYFLNAPYKNDIFKAEVKDDVSISFMLEEMWSNADFEYKDQSVWRYYGTENEVIRVKPGTRLAKKYTPTLRSWYKRALGYKLGIVISPAYVDAFGAGLVVTFSHVIYQGSSKKSHDSNDYILGVMGIDIKVDSFYKELRKTIKECQEPVKSCLMIDKSGLVIVHQDWIKNPNINLENIETQHISNKEPTVARYLQEKGIMKAGECFNLEVVKNQLYWTVSL